MRRLLLTRSLVVGADLFASLIENALNLTGIRTSGRERKVMLVSVGAIGWKNDAIGLGINSGVQDEPLALDVVENGLVGIDGESLIGRLDLSIGILLLEEDDGFIAKMECGAGGISPGGRKFRPDPRWPRRELPEVASWRPLPAPKLSCSWFPHRHTS